VQMARVGGVGERKGGVDVEVKGDAYRRIYQGPEARCQAAFWEVGEFAVRVRARFEGEGRGWGPFSGLVIAAFEFPPVRDVAYVDGVVGWSSVAGALLYEVQMAGPIDDSKEAKADEAQYKSVYQGSATSCAMGSGLAGDGEYRVRVRAELHAGWGPFSPLASFRQGMEWCADRKTEGIELTSDDRGLKRVARHNGPTSGYRSVLSSRPLAPPSPAPFALSSSSSPSSSALSGVASFKVRLDTLKRYCAWFGVSRALPEVGRVVGVSEGWGVGWNSRGGVYNDGQSVGQLGSYSDGAVIGVEVDYGAHTVSFFKNGWRQGQPIVLSERDRGQPLYAAVTLFYKGQQVTAIRKRVAS